MNGCKHAPKAHNNTNYCADCEPKSEKGCHHGYVWYTCSHCSSERHTKALALRVETLEADRDMYRARAEAQAKEIGDLKHELQETEIALYAHRATIQAILSTCEHAHGRKSLDLLRRIVRSGKPETTPGWHLCQIELLARKI